MLILVVLSVESVEFLGAISEPSANSKRPALSKADLPPRPLKEINACLGKSMALLRLRLLAAK